VSERAAVLSSLEAALARLRSALAQPKSEWTRDAAIQRFEFTFELGWKCVRRFAKDEGLDVGTPREALKTAMKVGWVDDDPVWLRMLEDRNRTSHTYNEATAEQIYSRLQAYADALAKLTRSLKDRQA
jgi:nucleotidyltransferase substrate binding protein (TIGR01987 family)